MKLGAHSASLAVENLEKSRVFYEALGFVIAGGDADQGWLVLRNNTCTIGLFQGMFEKNMITFNPGWDANAQPIEDYTDVRDLQKELKKSGIDFASEVDESGSGPGSFVIIDPDGNPVLVDQHV